ncbi:MAG TPA: class I SAM-dependent methyltransferase [Casimicrobiaceae bacterium]|nr:class I SAM-dependent methyltransferase [Casimicrobiaceae bacterium]
MDLASVFGEPLVDLGVATPAFEGIYTPESFHGATKVGVTAQFLENAEQYHKSYFDTGYWNFLLGNAFAAAGNPDAPKRIIDIGSGSGNSVIPLADRFPNAEIVATDISPQLLAILRDFLCRRSDGGERFGLVCVDAMAARYQPAVADLAVGAAILHHILEPKRVLASCFQALAPGGWAIFFEPFEAGNALLKFTYRRILAQASAAERLAPGLRFIQRMVEDYQRRELPADAAIYRELDDKWMFTRTYFDRVRGEQGWSEMITYALNVSPTGLRDQAAVHLRLGTGLAPDAIPAWAWSIVDETDASLSADLRRELAQEAAVLLRKPTRR